MARKLRLEVGDLVLCTYKKDWSNIIGVVQKAELNEKSEMVAWGVFQYTIEWFTDKDLQKYDWTIKDLTHGNIIYLGNNANAAKVLYGIDPR